MTDPDRNISDPMQTAQDAANRASSTAKDTAENLSDIAAGTAGETAETLSGGAAAARDEVADAVNEVRAAATEAMDAMAAQAKEAFANAKGAADEGVTFVKAKYRENPALVIAVGAAALVGVSAILKGMFGRR